MPSNSPPNGLSRVWGASKSTWGGAFDVLVTSVSNVPSQSRQECIAAYRLHPSPMLLAFAKFTGI